MAEKMAATETLETKTTFTQPISQNFIAYIRHESCKSYNYFPFICTETIRFEKRASKNPRNFEQHRTHVNKVTKGIYLTGRMTVIVSRFTPLG